MSTIRDRWLGYAMHEVATSCCQQVVIAILYADMDAYGSVQVGRADLAARIAKSERQAQERLRELTEHGLLRRVRRGGRAGPAIYQAVVSEQVQGVPTNAANSERNTFPQSGPVSEQVQDLPANGGRGFITTNGAVADSRASDDASFVRQGHGQRVTPDSDARELDDGTRGRADTEPQGVDYDAAMKLAAELFAVWYPDGCGSCGWPTDTVGHEVNCLEAA